MNEIVKILLIVFLSPIALCLGIITSYLLVYLPYILWFRKRSKNEK